MKKKGTNWSHVACIALLVSIPFLFCLLLSAEIMDKQQKGLVKVESEIAALEKMTPEAYLKKAKNDLLRKKANLENSLETFPDWARRSRSRSH